MPDNLIEQLPDRLEKALADLLGPNEAVHIKLKGAFKEGLICTDTRVIILKGGFMTGQVFGNDAFQQPYSNVAGVQVKFNILTGYFEMSAGGMQNTSKDFWSNNKNSDPSKAPNCVSLNSKVQAKRFQEACTFILAKIDESRTGSSRQAVPQVAATSEKDEILSALEKLGQLKQSGILTEEEFQSKKSDLLARL